MRLTYRCARHQPIVYFLLAHDPYFDVEAQGEAYEGEREEDELDDDEGRTPGDGVNVIWLWPCGQHLGRR